MNFFAYLVLFFLTFTTTVTAQSDSSQFNIRVFGAVDTEAPTTPNLLTINPIAPNQIDITWSAATDNFSVQGYVVSRDGSAIATTTLTSYSDTSVAASTTYAYSVQAFDLAGNYSTSSNILSTTTPDFPVAPPAPEVIEEDGTTIGTVARVVVRDFAIATGYSTTSIDITTVRPVMLSLRWGRTTSYELGYTVNEVFSDNHSLMLTDLEPGTTYEYELTAQLVTGVSEIVRSGQFTTQKDEAIAIPGNVSRFVATQNNADVNLSWLLPPVADVAYVRVLRSHLGFPQHPQDGAIVYQGGGTSFVDRNILNQFSPVYYTVFTYNTQGSVSSGAVAVVYGRSSGLGGGDDNQPADETPQIGVPVPTDVPTSTINQQYVTPEMKIPELSEIYIQQADKEFSFIGNKVVLNSVQPFTVAIPVWAVAGNLKSIIGTLIDPTDNRNRYSFLLRVNEDQTQYEAEIAPLYVQGKSALIVEIYDYEAAIVAKYQSPVEFVEVELKEEVVFPDAIYQRSSWLLLAAVLPFIVALILLLILRHRDEDNE